MNSYFSSFKTERVGGISPLTLLSCQIVIGTALLLVLSWILQKGLRLPRHTFPVTKVKDGDSVSVFANAIKSYGHTGFEFPTSDDDRIILPSTMIDEIKNLPETKLSFQRDVDVRMATRYTNIGRDDTGQGKDVIKLDLTQNIGNVMGDLQDEASYAFDTELGDLKDWTGVYVYAKLLQIIAFVTGRTFVGLPLCRDKEWRDATINYTVDGVAGSKAIGKYHPLVQPFVAPFIPELRKLKTYNKLVENKMRPIIESLFEIRQKTGKKNAKEDSTDTYNLAHWMMGRCNDDKLKVENISAFQLNASFAAIHTTSMTLSQALFDLAAHPEIVPELRAELESVLGEHGIDGGILQKSSMQKLKKLDSFLKESQRMNPLGATSMNRHVTAREGLTLSSGQHLPYGSRIAVALPLNPRIPVDPESKIIPVPESQPLNEFHPFRYSQLRSNAGEENKHQFVSVGHDSLSFGSGMHACPGRFFVANELKILMVELLKRYDIGMGPQGQGKSQGYDRPKDIVDGVSYLPDIRAQVYFKSRFA